MSSYVPAEKMAGKRDAGAAKLSLVEAVAHILGAWMKFFILTPSLLPPVKFPGWKMQGRTFKQSIFQSCDPSAFNAVHFYENPFKEEKA